MRGSCLLATIVLLGCDPSIQPARPDHDAGPRVTYYGDVRPLLVENCVMCHTEGGIAPFALGTYEEARHEALKIMDETRSRRMPPFLADNSGSCNVWANYRGLTDEEIDTISSWVLQGTPMGDPSTPAPDPVTLPTLPSVDLTLEMPREYTINQAIEDDYRCFVVEVDTTASVIVRGYDVQPGNTQRVHHVIVYNPQTAAAAQAARDADMEDNVMGDGYPCFGAASSPTTQVDASPLVLWAPGTGATMFPTSAGTPTGIRLEAGRAQVIQIHYNNSHNEEAPPTDRTTIQLTTVPDTCGSQVAYLFPVPNFSLELDPGRPDEVSSYTYAISDFVPSYAVLPIWGLLPHMHRLGTSIRVERIDSTGAEQCMIDIPHWDFDWQLAYFLPRPMNILGTDSVRITCHYDTTDRTDIVRWGEGTADEMCIAFAYVVDPRPRDGC